MRMQLTTQEDNEREKKKFIWKIINKWKGL